MDGSKKPLFYFGSVAAETNLPQRKIYFRINSIHPVRNFRLDLINGEKL
jgi:hypothetical protein